MFPLQDRKIIRIAFWIFLALVAGISLTGWHVYSVGRPVYPSHLFFLLAIPTTFLIATLLSSHLPLSQKVKKIIQIVLIMLMALVTAFFAIGWYLLSTGPLFNP